MLEIIRHPQQKPFVRILEDGENRKANFETYFM